jgi:hypothetical protein
LEVGQKPTVKVGYRVCNVTGDSVTCNVTGDSVTCNVTGDSVTCNVTGDSVTCNVTGDTTGCVVIMAHELLGKNHTTVNSRVIM